MKSNKTGISRNLTEKKMEMDRAYVKKIQQQYHKKSPPMEPTRTKKKRQAQEHMSGAGDEGGTSHMGHNGDNSSRPRAMEATRWWPKLHYRSNKGIIQVKVLKLQQLQRRS